MKDDRTDWVDMRVPEGRDWLEYMMNVKNPTPRTLGVMNHMALGVPSMADGVQDGAGSGDDGAAAAEDRAGRQVAVESLRSEPDARGIDGAQAGGDALLLPYDGAIKSRPLVNASE